MISGGVIGAGADATDRVRWGVASNIGFAWALTLPIAGAFGAAAYGVMRAFGTGPTGPVIVAVGTALLIAALFARRARQERRFPRGDMGLMALIDSEALLESVVASVVAGVGSRSRSRSRSTGSRGLATRRGEATVAAGFAATVTVLELAAWVAAITVES